MPEQSLCLEHLHHLENLFCTRQHRVPYHLSSFFRNDISNSANTSGNQRRTTQTNHIHLTSYLLFITCTSIHSLATMFTALRTAIRPTARLVQTQVSVSVAAKPMSLSRQAIRFASTSKSLRCLCFQQMS
jgi:hypothetical protein